MLIRKATLEDATEIAKVHISSWRTTYQGIVPDLYLESLTLNSRLPLWQQLLQKVEHIYVAVNEGGQLVGFISAGDEQSGEMENVGEITTLYLLEEAQGKGLGKQLLHHAFQNLQAKRYSSMIVWVLADNPACGFYEKMGGVRWTEKVISFAGKKLIEYAYRWEEF